jgi:hypothetical protein
MLPQIVIAITYSVKTGPKSVKLFSNKEHMGFRYATFLVLTEAH